MSALYSTKVTATGGRSGRIASDEQEPKEHKTKSKAAAVKDDAKTRKAENHEPNRA